MINKTCYDKLWHDFELTNGECLQLLFSKVIGFSIVAITSIMIKMPQIMKMLKSKKADGVNLWSHVLMNIASTSSFTYGMVKNFSVSIWGESLALSVQNGVISVLICLYCGQRKVLAAGITVILSLIAASLMLPYVPWSIRYVFVMLNFPLISTSKAMQIYTNFRNSGTGQLSAISVVMMNFRSMGRLFTYFIETEDSVKILLYLMATFFNIILLSQVVYYNRLKKKKEKEM